MQKMNPRSTLPFSFFNASEVALTNYSANEIILESLPIPEGFKGIVKDNDLTFTTGGGSVDYVIRRASGDEQIFRQNISSDDSGFINKVLHEGDVLLIKLNSTGVGIFDIVWDGEIQKTREIMEVAPLVIDDFGDVDL